MVADELQELRKRVEALDGKLEALEVVEGKLDAVLELMNTLVHAIRSAGGEEEPDEESAALAQLEAQHQGVSARMREEIRERVS